MRLVDVVVLWHSPNFSECQPQDILSKYVATVTNFNKMSMCWYMMVYFAIFRLTRTWTTVGQNIATLLRTSLFVRVSSSGFRCWRRMSSHENPIVPYANKAHDREETLLIYRASYIWSGLYTEHLIYRAAYI